MSKAVAQQPAARDADVMVAMSHDGGRVLVADGEAVRFAEGRVVMRGAHACAITLVEGEAWVVVEDGGEHTLRRFDVAGDPLEPALRLGRLGANLRLTATRIGVRSALIEGDRAVFVREQAVEELGERGRDRRVLIGGRGVAERSGGALVFRRTGAIALPGDLAAAAVVGGAMVFDGSAALIELDRAGHRTAVVFDLRRGAVHTRIRLGEAAILAVAERRGLVVLGRGVHVALCDLRAGRCVGERILPAPVRACAIDADGTRLIVNDAIGTLHTLAASMANWSAPAPASSDTEPERGGPETAPDRDECANAASRDGIELHRSEAAGDGTSERSKATGDGEREPADDVPPRHDLAGDAARDPTGDMPVRADLAGDGERQPAGDPTPHDRAGMPDEIAQRAPELGHPDDPMLMVVDESKTEAETKAEIDSGDGVSFPLELRAFGPRPPTEALSPTSLTAYQADACAWIVSLCRTALAATAAPEGEVDRLGVARDAEREASVRFAYWCRPGAPHVELARAFGLSPTALWVLILAAAPQIWGELARTYRALAAAPGRPLVDELLLAQLLDADFATRTAIGRELDPFAPLVRQGLVEVAGGLRPFAAVSVHPVVARRLVGTQAVAPVSPTIALEDVIGPRRALAALAARLASPADTPVRVVIRGRASAGRNTIAAALAARAGRRIGLVDVDAAMVATDGALPRALRDVSVRDDLPCVRLDELCDDPATRTQVRAALDNHAGPLLLCARATGELPLAPGYHALELPALDERQRHEAWERALRAHALDPALAPIFAARSAVGPGAIVRACAAVADGDPEPVASLTAALRQHRAAHIHEIACRVDRLAIWNDLVVPDDLHDALREIVARVRHRDIVLGTWGMSRVASTARGVTALFQGGARDRQDHGRWGRRPSAGLRAVARRSLKSDVQVDG